MRGLKMQIVMLGDSITQGWDGHKTVAKPMSKIISETLGFTVSNLAQGGSEVSGNRSNDAATILAAHKFTKYTIAIVMYGTNDLNLSANSLDQVKNSLQKLIERLYHDNSKMLILGITPPQSFLVGNKMTDKGKGGYNQSQLCDAELKVYQANNCYTLDWRDNPIITASNRQATLGDQRLHPTQATYQLMADRIIDHLLPLISQATQVLLPWSGKIDLLATNLKINFALINQKLAAAVEVINKQALSPNSVAITPVSTLPPAFLNRTAYLWIRATFKQVTANINQLLKLFNENMFYASNNQVAELVHLANLPGILIGQTVYNDCWQQLQTGLNKITDIMQYNQLT